MRSNTRSSARLEHSSGENAFAAARDKTATRTATAPSALTDVTNISGRFTGLSLAASKVPKSNGAPLSARPPVPAPVAAPAPDHVAAPAAVAAAPSGSSLLSAAPSSAWAVRPDGAFAQGDNSADTASSDPQCVVEYVEDIYANLREAEKEADAPKPEYMEQQLDVNSRMRSILVDWLIEVALKYKLRPETVFLAISIIDRFLAKKRVSRKRLQLCGVVSLLIASKYEEINPPEIRNLVYICDRAYTKEEILQMEVVMLNTLDFQLKTPTIMPFLDRFARINGCSDMHRQLAQYVAELSLIELRMIRHSPSHIAAATVFLSNKLLKQHPSWPQEMVDQTGYQESTIRSCAKELCTLLEGAPTNSLQAVQKKFSFASHHGVSKIPF